MAYSSLYKRHFPLRNNGEIRELEQRERKDLSNWVRNFPYEVNIWNTDCKSGRLGSRWYYNFDLLVIEVCPACDELADKILNERCLTDKEIFIVNMVLCAHKYNWFWKAIFFHHPAKDVAEFIQKYTESIEDPCTMVKKLNSICK